MLKTTRANLNKRMAVVLHREAPRDQRGRRQEGDARRDRREGHQRRHHPRRVQQPVPDHRPDGRRGARAGAAAALRLAVTRRSIRSRSAPSARASGAENIDKGVHALLDRHGRRCSCSWRIYYRVFGLVADLVLLANVVLLTALLSMMRASLSLPGIAGIILTVGMAVDANVLIYERIREEAAQRRLAAGGDPRRLREGVLGHRRFQRHDADRRPRAVGASAPAPIRGFAIVLTLGIATSMFTSLHGQPRADHTHVRRAAQAHPSVDLRLPARRTNVEFFTSRPASRSWPPARCGTRCRRSS